MQIYHDSEAAIQLGTPFRKQSYFNLQIQEPHKTLPNYFSLQLKFNTKLLHQE